MREYDELLVGDATGQSSLFFFSAVSSRKIMEIGSTKLTNPNKPLAKTDNTFLKKKKNTQINLRSSLQPESMCVSLLAFKNF